MRRIFIVLLHCVAKLQSMKSRSVVLAAWVIAGSIASLLVGCSANTESKTTGPLVLKGAGATAPNLAYSKWLTEFKKEEPNLDVQYHAIGSGEGIHQLQAGTVDFAASDIPLTDEQIAGMKVKPLHFPTLISAIVPVYNVAGAGALNFTGEALAGIFSGKIKTWNDAAIAKANPEVALPASHIVVVHRSDASGSTYVLTDYLSKVSETWKKNVGQGAAVRWPIGEGATGNEALGELVKKTPNAIGYVELNYAEELKLSYGNVMNSAGKFQKPDLPALGVSVDAVQNLKHDFRASITNAPGEGAYPICTLTWIIVPSQIGDIGKQKAMKRFLRWGYTAGQKLAMPMDYGVLQPPLLNRVQDQVDNIH